MTRRNNQLRSRDGGCPSPSAGARGPSMRAVVALIAALVLLTACGCVQKMADQPRVDTLEGSHFFADGLGAREQVAGTIAQGQAWETTPTNTGKQDGQPVKDIPLDVDGALLARGRERFGIFCSHCHGPDGYGNGMVVQRGFPQPPSYHIDRLRNAPAGHFFLVISDGIGRMPSFRARIEPSDRWAIVAYIRALQLSQHAEVGNLPEEDKQALRRIESGTVAGGTNDEKANE